MALLKHALILSVSLAAALALFALLIRLLEDRLTFHPTRELEALPSDFGLAFEEALIRSGADSLHGWLFPPSGSQSPVLLVFHGNAGNISHRLEWIAPFVRRGLGVLLFDYRGYGKSSGKPSEQAFREDALAAWDWLTARGIEPGRIVAFGRSIGGAPAVYLASREPVRALILEGAFTSGRDMARLIFGFIPAHRLMKNRWEVEDCLAGIDSPVLLIHGTSDQVVPFELGERLSRKALRGQWWPVQGGNHLDAHFLLGERYYERVECFLRENSPVPAE